MAHLWAKLDEIISQRIWDTDILSASRLKARVISFLRLIYCVVRDLLDGELSLRAMSLVYTTLLSLVPLLAVTFSVLKAFGVHNQLEPALASVLEPLGPKASVITQRVVEFVDNTRVGVLGSVGLVLLIYTVVSLAQKIEANLNFIWRIGRPRPLVQRFSEYISIILVGPVLVFAAIGVTASISSTALVQQILSIEAVGTLVHWVARLIPYFLVCAAFTFFYVFVPNTRVRLGSALVGGLVAGIMWQTVGWLFASFVAASARYAAIYSSFAVLILFMIWLYVSWYILLIGAQIAYYHQHPQTSRMRMASSGLLIGSTRERLALLIMYLIGYNHYYDKPLWNTDALAVHVGLSDELVQTVIDQLVEGGFVVQTSDEPAAYVPARDIEKISLTAVLSSVRGPALTSNDELVGAAELNAVMARVEKGITSAVGAQTVKSLVLTTEGPAEAQLVQSSRLSASTRKTVG
ncbi:MAG: YihY/virulence factor BrkB family protein [Acidiferrobacterales bacterium]